MIKWLNQQVRRYWSCFMSLGDILIVLVLCSAVYWGFVILSDSTMDFKDRNSIFIALGGFILSILVLYATIIRPFFRKPRFAFQVTKQWSEPESNDSGSWFYRLKIENYGLLRAKNCVGRLIEVWPDKGELLTKFDPLYLYWSRQNKLKIGIDGQEKEIITFKPIDIQSHRDFYFLDLIQVKENKITLRVVLDKGMTLTKGKDNSVSPGNEPTLSIPGTYYIRVGVYGEDADIKPTYLRISCPSVTLPLNSETAPCEVKPIRGLPRYMKRYATNPH